MFIRFAYRRFGKAGRVPVVFNQHYLGTVDYRVPVVQAVGSVC